MAQRDTERPSGAAAMDFSATPKRREQDARSRNLDALLDVRIPITVEVGATELPLQTILDVVPGTVIPLDKRVDDPLDLCVNGKLVARGEIVSVDGCYALRITEIVDAEERLESLR